MIPIKIEIPNIFFPLGFPWIIQTMPRMQPMPEQKMATSHSPTERSSSPSPLATDIFLVCAFFSLAMAGGAAAALVVGWVRPAPWLLALMLVSILSVLWIFAVSRFLRADAWHEEESNA